MILTLGVLGDVELGVVALAATVGVIALVAILISNICQLARQRRKIQRAIGYDYGLTDGYKRRLAEEELLRAMADADPGGDFTEALLSGALHEPVSEEMASLLGAVQEHERAARTEAAR